MQLCTLATISPASKVSGNVVTGFLGTRLPRSAAQITRAKPAGSVESVMGKHPELQSLKLAGQEHLISQWDELDSQKQAQLLKELKEFDFEYVDRVFTASTKASHDQAKVDIEPFTQVLSLTDGTPEQRRQWREQGLQLVAQGKVGILLLAGGQGTRLGSSLPKGCYDIGLPSHKSLFQNQAERVLRLQQLAAAAFPQQKAVSLRWIIMTSPFTHDDTLSHFEQHAYFGLQKSQVTFFQQGSLPCLTEEGKVIMASDCTLAQAPDGNGGVYMALRSAGILDMLTDAGVEALDCYCVDNALARLGDPLFLGYCHAQAAQVGARVVAKAYPDEKVGVFASKEGALSVVEYSEMDPEQAREVDPDTGRLRFNYANICMHYFTVQWLHQVTDYLARGAAYHIARKKIPSKDGPVQGIKLELFIFDTFHTASRVALMEVERAAEFAPVKNAPGSPSDSPDTARAAVLQQGAGWVRAAGGQLAEGLQGVEVSPLVSYAGEGLEGLVAHRSITNMLDEQLQGGLKTAS